MHQGIQVHIIIVLHVNSCSSFNDTKNMKKFAMKFVILLCLLSVNRSSSSDVTFTKPEQIYSQDYPNHIVLGMIVINIKSSTTTSDLFMEDISQMVESLLSWSSGTPLCFIVITDEKSAQGNLLHDVFSPFHLLYLINLIRLNYARI